MIFTRSRFPVRWLLVAAILFSLLVPAAWASFPPRFFDAADFGAVPGDERDDTEAIHDAIRAANEAGGGVVRFEPGVYRISKQPHEGMTEPGERTALLLDGVRGVTLQGDATTLELQASSLDDYAHSIRVMDCEAVTLRGLTLDWSIWPMMLARVEEVEASGLVLSLDRPLELEGEFGLQRLETWDVQKNFHSFTSPRFGRRPGEGGLALGRPVEVLSDTRLRVFFGDREIGFGGVTGATADKLAAIKPGTPYVVTPRIYGANAISVERSKDVLAEDVTLHTTAGMGFKALQSEDLTLRRFVVTPPPDAPAAYSLTADATHFFSCRGTVTLEDCHFEGQGDDGLNIHGRFVKLAEVLGARRVRLGIAWPFLPIHEGEELELLDRNAHAVWVGRVVEVEQPSGGKAFVTFDRDLPPEAEPGLVFGDLSWTAKLVVRDSTFRRFRGRALLIQTRDAEVTGNRVEDAVSVGILARTTLRQTHAESITAKRLRIENNTVIRSPYSNNIAGIAVYAHKMTDKGPPQVAPAGALEDIRIIGNRVTDMPNIGIYVASTRGLEIRDNVLARCHQDTRPQLWDGAAPHTIVIRQCDDVRIEGNRYLGPDDGTILKQFQEEGSDVTLGTNPGLARREMPN